MVLLPEPDRPVNQSVKPVFSSFTWGFLSNGSGDRSWCGGYLACSPHSILPVPRQRPERSSADWPLTDAVHGMHPIDG